MVAVLLVGQGLIVRNAMLPALDSVSRNREAELQRIVGLLGDLKASGRVDELSADQDAELKSLEGILGDQKRLSTTIAEAEMLRSRCDHLIRDTRPGVQLEAAPRLLPVRWGVEAVSIARQEHQKLRENPAELAESLSSLLERKPENGQRHLEDLVRDLLKRATETAGRKTRELAVLRAMDAVLWPKDVQKLAGALDGLEGLTGPGVDRIRGALRYWIVGIGRRQRISELEHSFKQSKGLEENRLRQAALAKVQDAAISVLLDWETEQPRPEASLKHVRALIEGCRESLDEIARAEQREAAKKVCEYQRWALEQISRFNKWEYDAVLPRIEKFLKELGGSTGENEWELLGVFPEMTKGVTRDRLGIDLSEVEDSILPLEKQKQIYREHWKNAIHTELAYGSTREAMIAFLQPIIASYLDPPVAQLYQQAFAKGCEKLEGRPDQLEVAKAAVRVAKKPLE
jgi:hypothetical protein